MPKRERNWCVMNAKHSSTNMAIWYLKSQDFSNNEWEKDAKWNQLLRVSKLNCYFNFLLTWEINLMWSSLGVCFLLSIFVFFLHSFVYIHARKICEPLELPGFLHVQVIKCDCKAEKSKTLPDRCAGLICNYRKGWGRGYQCKWRVNPRVCILFPWY